MEVPGPGVPGPSGGLDVTRIVTDSGPRDPLGKIIGALFSAGTIVVDIGDVAQLVEHEATDILAG